MIVDVYVVATQNGDKGTVSVSDMRAGNLQRNVPYR